MVDPVWLGVIACKTPAWQQPKRWLSRGFFFSRLLDQWEKQVLSWLAITQTAQCYSSMYESHRTWGTKYKEETSAGQFPVHTLRGRADCDAGCSRAHETMSNTRSKHWLATRRWLRLKIWPTFRHTSVLLSIWSASMGVVALSFEFVNRRRRSYNLRVS